MPGEDPFQMIAIDKSWEEISAAAETYTDEKGKKLSKSALEDLRRYYDEHQDRKAQRGKPRKKEEKFWRHPADALAESTTRMMSMLGPEGGRRRTRKSKKRSKRTRRR